MEKTVSLKWSSHVISVRASEVDDASTVTSSNQDCAGSSSDSSDDSSTTDEPAPSVASEDHNMLVQAYGMTQNHFTVTRHALAGGRATLNIMDIYPMHWPLPRSNFLLTTSSNE